MHLQDKLVVIEIAEDDFVVLVGHCIFPAPGASSANDIDVPGDTHSVFAAPIH